MYSTTKTRNRVSNYFQDYKCIEKVLEFKQLQKLKIYTGPCKRKQTTNNVKKMKNNHISKMNKGKNFLLKTNYWTPDGSRKCPIN